jgi:hypothetical protein
MRQAELDADAQAAPGARHARSRTCGHRQDRRRAGAFRTTNKPCCNANCPMANIVLFPADPRAAREIPPLAGTRGRVLRRRIRHPPNADGICWFAEAVWPRVLEAVPRARLYIVGSHMTPQVQALPACPESVPWDTSRISMRSSIEGASAWRPCDTVPAPRGKGGWEPRARACRRLCTPIAAEGMGLAPGVDVLVGNDAEEFAAHVVALLGDDAQWRRLSDAGLAYARETTSGRVRTGGSAMCSDWSPCGLVASDHQPQAIRNHAAAERFVRRWLPISNAMLAAPSRKPATPGLLHGVAHDLSAAVRPEDEQLQVGRRIREVPQQVPESEIDPSRAGKPPQSAPSRTCLRIAADGPCGMMLASYSSMTSIPPPGARDLFEPDRLVGDAAQVAWCCATRGR